MQGIELCRRFYVEIVEPLMKNFASIEHSAALIGPGSEVLGYDTEMSRDHDYSPRVYLFLNELDNGLSENIRALFDQRFPQSFYGFPINTKMTVITTVPRFIEGHAFNNAYKHLSRMHNELGITEKIPDDVSYFFERPYKVMKGERIASLIANQIMDIDILQLSKKRLIGNIDQITDNTDFRKMNRWSDGEGECARNTLKKLFNSSFKFHGGH